jgi:hypothetical protein
MGNLEPAPGNLELVKRAMGKLPLGPRGKPLKADVDALWKRLTKELQQKARTRANMARLEAKVAVPNWVPANMRNQFKNVLIQTALSKAKVANKKAAVQAWINGKIPKVGILARNVENMVTGEIKHLPAWNPPREFKYKIPKLSPVAKPEGAKPKVAKSPSTKRKTIPATNNFELLVNNMNRLGVPYNANKAYSWANLKKMGINNKYKNTWYKHVKGK